jgi:hypothetical protein
MRQERALDFFDFPGSCARQSSNNALNKMRTMAAKPAVKSWGFDTLEPSVGGWRHITCGARRQRVE